MDRVIPKDVVDLIYKEAHIDKIKRLNEEYHELFECANYFVRYKTNHFGYGFRSFNFMGYNTINTFRNGKIFWVADLPKRYFYSSGNNELKWIE